ncbi:hypothetical protein GALMADRAFT_137695 [Galerina marginata CBS 339.88]|uniref:DUF6534 domain-containing protein n=1 Tax=Galerina marginata (strain CBS 339.88) TaxID=685588 RepID=A0A067T650_GALM3|nr:hypothetical protein GALMADRAFT_137695 [Galerina marginata CBS 339.88]
MSIPHINLNTTLGAVFVGNIVAAALFGITTLQTFIFFNKNTRDRKLFKQLIAFLWSAYGFSPPSIHDPWRLSLSNKQLLQLFCIRKANLEPPLSSTDNVHQRLHSQMRLRSENLAIKRAQHGSAPRHRRRFFSLPPYFLVSSNGWNNQVAASTFVFGTGIAFAARGFIDMSYVKLIMESWLLYTALSGSVLADGFITASLCTLLYQNRTGFKSTDSLVNTLMLYSINTGLLTSICATACFVTFAIWPHQFVFIGIYFTLGKRKLYVNSLLAVLNTRETLRKRNSGMTTIPLSPSSIEPLTMNFVMSTTVQTSETSSPTVAKPQPPKLAWHDKKWK